MRNASDSSTTSGSQNNRNAAPSKVGEDASTKLGLDARIEAIPDMCVWAFDTLINRLRNGTDEVCVPKRIRRMQDANITFPAFVTWTKKSWKSNLNEFSYSLRGCIGSLQPINPFQIAEYALKSALRDGRFSPITLKEVHLLTCQISLLHSFEDATDVYDWEVGTHGIIINFFEDCGRKRNATYLPEVPLKHGMSKETTICELIKKSSFKGPITEELLQRIQLTRYQSSRCSLDYESYSQDFK